MDVNAKTLPRLIQDPFAGPEHRAFTLEGGAPGALLLHGFLGTPDETRALAQMLHRAGWTVHCPLLPGFGPDIATLLDRTQEMWVAAADDALRSVRGDHDPVLLLGHSMGGAIALHLAARHPVDGLVLTAPFWQIPVPHPALHVLWPALALVVRRIRPFRFADLDEPEVQAFVRNLRADVDLDDPEVQATLRDLTVTTGVLNELRDLGRRASALAPGIHGPKLILQGSEDETVPPDRTRALLRRLPAPLAYHEYPADHYLIQARAKGWSQTARQVQTFAQALQTQPI